MKHSHILFAVFATACAAAPVARADSFSFTFGTPGVSPISGSGLLTGTLNADGSYTITSASGTSDAGDGVTDTIASLEAPGTYESNDNLLYDDGAGGYSFTYDGLSYLLNGGSQVNLIGEFAEDTLLAGASESNSYAEPLTITANTPEPGSLLLLGTGLVSVVALTRRRFAL